MSVADRRVLSLFSGVGGLDLGLQVAGWSVVAQIESDAACADSLRAHTCGSGDKTEVIQARIEEIEPHGLRRAMKLRRGELALIAGGPPCQPFTTHGLRKGMNDLRVASLFPQYLQYVREFMPAAILMENVDGILSAALRHRPLALRGKSHPALAWEEMKGSFLHWLLGQLVGLGYAVTWGVAEAADYGVPQMRQRAFLIGTRDGDPCFLPRPRHGWPGMRPYRTLREGLRDVCDPGPIQPLSAFKQSVYRRIPPGGNWRDLPVHLQRKTMGAAFNATGGKSGWWRRLAWDEPAPTILGMPDHSSTGLIHPDEVRCLGLNECARLQTFPRWAKFGGRPRAQYQQVGNAVPPRVGSVMGRTLSRHLEGHRQRTPKPPEWRQQSANRRIGTHGWVTPASRGPRFTLVVKVRGDHVWAADQRQHERA